MREKKAGILWMPAFLLLFQLIAHGRQLPSDLLHMGGVPGLQHHGDHAGSHVGMLILPGMVDAEDVGAAVRHHLQKLQQAAGLIRHLRADLCDPPGLGQALGDDPGQRGHVHIAAGQQGGAVRLALQQRLAREGAAALLEELAAIDPETAARLHLRDEKRILRALEVYRETGETISEHDRKSREMPNRYDALYIGLSFRDRQELRDRIDRRVDIMVEQGLLDEVRQLLTGGLPRDATALQAIGFKQFLAVADGTATEAEAVEEVKLRSRQYAKRQLTWLRRNPRIHWILWGKEPDFPWALQNATEFLTAAGVC